ncbi:MAG TPA: hypothetical protein VFQ88_12680 [Nevskiaceae bacterium]|nr:hypothetical protein [Nevskiaceae bacterium]
MTTKTALAARTLCTKALGVLLLCGVWSVSAVAAPAPAPAAHKPPTAKGTTAGTTIVSGDESPIGLYITPWKNAFTQQGLYEPQTHRLQVLPEPADPDTFKRQNVYYNTISAYRAKQRADHARH